jgi:hypothetical protein
MEIGGMTLLMSTALGSLAVAASLNLALSGRRRAAVSLGFTLALLATAGQGYLQIAYAVGILPALGVFILNDRLRVQPVAKEFFLACVLGLLMGAYFLVPLLHFWPQFGKDLDPTFQTAQHLRYIPLNLVLDNAEIFRQEFLTEHPWPYLYLNYIGWVPVLLAIFAMRLVPRRENRLLVFFLLSISLIFLSASALPFEALRRILPNLAAAVRNPSLMLSLAVPLILCLAAWGLDRLLALDWPRLTWDHDSEEPVSISISWLVLALPLIFSLKSGYDFSQQWLTTMETPPGVVEATQLMDPGETAWVSPPVGEHFWNPVVIGAGLKVTDRIVPWHWKDRQKPPSSIDGRRDYVTFQGVVNLVGEVEGVTVLTHDEHKYAFIDSASGVVPCEATAIGGHIDVSCNSASDGTLTVMENTWDGWTVETDGAIASLGSGPWLTTDAPAGEHQFKFRYRPWDIPAGLLLSLAGLGLAGWFWLRSDDEEQS